MAYPSQNFTNIPPQLFLDILCTDGQTDRQTDTIDHKYLRTSSTGTTVGHYVLDCLADSPTYTTRSAWTRIASIKCRASAPNRNTIAMTMSVWPSPDIANNGRLWALDSELLSAHRTTRHKTLLNWVTSFRHFFPKNFPWLFHDCVTPHNSASFSALT